MFGMSLNTIFERIIYILLIIIIILLLLIQIIIIITLALHLYMKIEMNRRMRRIIIPHNIILRENIE